jgi:hypothetical protein
MYNAGRFQYFDHGFAKNLWLYASRSPPEYLLQMVTTKVLLYWGENDWLSQEPVRWIFLTSSSSKFHLSLFQQYQTSVHINSAVYCAHFPLRLELNRFEFCPLFDSFVP